MLLLILIHWCTFLLKRNDQKIVIKHSLFQEFVDKYFEVNKETRKDLCACANAWIICMFLRCLTEELGKTYLTRLKVRNCR